VVEVLVRTGDSWLSANLRRSKVVIVMPWFFDNPNRLTGRAQRVLCVATNHATSHQQAQVTPEHVLFALAQVEPGPARAALELLGVDLTQRLAELEGIANQHPLETKRTIAESRQPELLLQYANDEAQSLGHDFIGTEHLVLGMFHCGNCPAVCFLERCGVNAESFRSALLCVLIFPSSYAQLP
jgi:ATP-dependent Clp protease ATP-binding subunit ClpC